MNKQIASSLNEFVSGVITSSCARVVAALVAIITLLYNRMKLDFKLAGHLEIPLLFVWCLGRIVLR